MAWSDVVSLDDEHFHPRTEDPWWNESSYFSFRLPERKLMGFVYNYFRPNQNTAMGGPVVFDTSGEELSTCLHTGWDWHMPIPDGAEMFDFKLENSLAIEMLEPQVSYRLGYDAPGCSFDLTYSADHRPYYMKLDDKQEVNAGMADLVQDVSEPVQTGHYEQYGRIDGTLVVNGETVDVVDAAVLRDHSWGARKVIQPLVKWRGGYCFARGSADNAFNLFAVNQQPWEEDPFEDTTEQVVSGFYIKDGIEGALVSGERRCVERGSDGRPLRETIEAKDHLGRTLQADGEVVCMVKWPALYGDYMVFWCYEAWSFDGHTDAPGELQDYIMCRHYSRWMRSKRGAAAVAM
jgi:hypothetical protein